VLEERVAKLAVEGLTMREIAARLNLHERRVPLALRFVFDNLGINTRRDLKQALAGHHLSESQGDL
jgi:DNA-binding NarL/FixJ family response regulator